MLSMMRYNFANVNKVKYDIPVHRPVAIPRILQKINKYILMKQLFYTISWIIGINDVSRIFFNWRWEWVNEVNHNLIS